MALVVNDPSKPQLTLLEYSREIGPMIRELIKKKEVLKEFVTENETVDEFKAQIKSVQDDMKKYLADHEDYKDLYEAIAELENSIKQAVKGAERATDKKYPAALLKGYFVARAKETVEKTVEKGGQFTELTKIIMEPKE